MIQGRSRQLLKDFLVQSRIKLVHDRITQTRYSLYYFCISAFTCVLLCALQGVILADNTKGLDILTKAVDQADPAPHITILTPKGELQVCETIPGDDNDGCMVLWLSGMQAVRSPLRRSAKFRRQEIPPTVEPESETSDEEDDGDESSDDDDSVESEDEDGAESDDEDEGDNEDVEATSSSPTATVLGQTASTLSSTSPTSTVTSTSTSISISSTQTATPSETMTVVFPTSSAPAPAPPQPTSGGGEQRTAGNGINLSQSPNSPHTMQCIYALSWVEEVLHDSQREDVATFFLQIWVFGLGLVAILNESIPHLGAAVFGHILAAAWASTRIQGSRSLAKFYRDTIVRGPCTSADLLGDWWELRLAHTIPVVVFNLLSVIALGFLSWKLLRVYASATFSRVGPTLDVQRVYRLVLIFSAGLQLASFFTAVSIGLWIAKAGHGSYKMLSSHGNIYVAAFVVILLAEIPWLILGWMCVRKECKMRFVAFLLLSALLVGISSAMFSSNLYRTIFNSWRLFAVVTITSFILLVVTVAFGIVCYLNFGRGLAHYLQVQDALAGSDFTPVYFPRDANTDRDAEKLDFYDDGYPNFNPTRGQTPYTGFDKSNEKDLPWTLPSRPASSSASQAPAATVAPRLHDPTSLQAGRTDNTKSMWSADSADLDLSGPDMLSTPEILSKMPLPPAASVPAHHGRVHSGVSSLVAFQGLPAFPPSTPTSAKAQSNRDSAGSIGSVRSTRSATGTLRRSPFPTAPVRTLTIPGQARAGSGLVDSYYDGSANPFSDRHASIMSEGTVVQEVPRNMLFVTNGLPTPTMRG